MLSQLFHLSDSACSLVKEFLYPTRCVGCDASSTLLCDSCQKILPWIDQKWACPVCGAPYGWLVCTECKKDWASSTCISAFRYAGPAAKLITCYKDHFEGRLIPVLVAALLGALEEAQNLERLYLSAFDAITFIPASASAYARRGFDHMEYIARLLAQETSTALADVLIHHHTKDQRKFGREDRIANVAGAFEAITDVSGAHILLIDDVITTGASIREATQALLKRGAAQVACASIARTF